MADTSTSGSEAVAAYQAGDFENAVRGFSAFLASATDLEARGTALNNRAAALLELCRHDEAEEDARECVKTRPDWAKSYLRLGQVLEATGKHADACEMYAEAMRRSKALCNALLEPLQLANQVCRKFNAEFITDLDRGYHYCLSCEKKDCKLRRCGKCRVAQYCCEEHQRQHWAKHKKRCSSLAEAESERRKLLAAPSPAEIAERIVVTRSAGDWTDLQDWDGFWSSANMPGAITDSQLWKACEQMSWPLTLAAGLCKFDLAQKKGVHVHVLGATNSVDKTALTSALIARLPLLDMQITLVGPDLTPCDQLVLRTQSNASICLSVQKALWHEFAIQPVFELPDLAVAYHPNLLEDDGPWKKTFRQLVLLKVPTVFTAWSEEEQMKTQEILSNELVRGVVEFHGPAPFASPARDIVGIAQSIVRRNSWWIGVKGGNAPSDESVQAEMQGCVARVSGISEEELDRISSNPQDPENRAKLHEVKAALDENQLMVEITCAIDEYNKGNELLSKGNVDDAVKALRRSIKFASHASASPKSSEVLATAHAELGNALRAKCLHDEAVAEYNQSLKIDADRADTHHNLGVALACKGDSAGAVSAFRRATELDPEDPEAFSGLGSASVHVGDARGAFEAFQRATQLAPTNPRYREQLMSLVSMLRSAEKS